MELLEPAKLKNRLRAVHRREQSLHLRMGLLVLCAWITGLFLAGFALDWLIRLPGLVRMILLVPLVAIPLVKAWRSGRGFFKFFSPVRSALSVESHYQNLESLLVTGVQIGTDQAAGGTSAAMAAHTVKRADEAAERLDAGEVVSYKGLRNPAVIAGCLLAVIVVFAIISLPIFSTALTRLFMPWQEVNYPTRTQLALENGEIVVQEGEAVKIRAILSGRIPAKAKLSIRTGEGEPRKRTLEVNNGACVHEMAAVFRSFEYAIRAGDADSGWHPVKVISSPRITKSRIRVVYPDYMDREPETREAMTLTVPEGTRLEWDLQLDQPVRAAKFRIGGAEPVTLETGDDGLSVRHAMEAGASDAYAFAWVEKQRGFRFDSAKHYLQVAPDQPPQIELASPGKNLFATIGRELVLSYRASDDHGIGETKVAFRLNNTAEQLVVIPSEALAGRATREVEWDYRKALPDLEVGDTLALAIEVSDRYPASPHRVRSESRRVTFLSKEDYLAKMHEQKRRLLAQLRTVYRQERAACEVVGKLDPGDASFEQTCFLESSRQDIVNERIMKLGTSVQELMADLAANNITDKTEFAGLHEVRERLAGLSKNHISVIAAELRDLGPSTNRDAEDVAKTAAGINMAARELASMVLQLGVREAMEVFGRELHVITETQSVLRVKTIGAEDDTAALSATQEELATWIGRMLGELDALQDYSRSPLTVVRLARLVKDLRHAGIEMSMRRAAGMLADGKGAEAAALQQAVGTDLFALETKIRIGAEREALFRARDLFTNGINELEQAADKELPAREVARLLAGLQRKLRLLILPALPAPGASLLADKPTEIPPVENLLATLRGSLQQATDAIGSGKPDSARDQQQQALASLRRLLGIIETRLAETGKSSLYAGNSGASMERSMLVREMHASQMRLTEKTEDADYDGASGAYLAPSQLQLAKEVLRMKERLEELNDRPANASRMLQPMLRMLEEASTAMTQAGPALQANKLGDAIDAQDLALNALEAAMGFSNQEAKVLVGLANLVMTTEGLEVPAGYMKDIVGEQEDLIGATRKSKPGDTRRLIAIQQNLGQAVFEVSELVAGTGASLDFEQAMTFAGSDMGLSVLKLKSGEIPAAVQAQTLAAESVAELRDHFDASVKQFQYFVTVLEFLNERHTDGVVLHSRLGVLRRKLEDPERGELKAHAAALAALQQEAHTFSELLLGATGRGDYAGAQPALDNAVRELKAGEADACVDELASAEDAVQTSLDELRELMANVAYVPGVEPVEAPPEFEVMLDMVDLLVSQQDLAVAVYRAEKEELAGLVPDLRDLRDETMDLIQTTNRHESIIAAGKSMAEALNLVRQSSQAAAHQSLLKSEAGLRHCILEYALYYIEIPRPKGSKRKKKGKSGIVDDFKLSLKIKPAYDKTYGGVEGEDPRSGRSEWEVLGSRDRAALNENFVRELPLEYRGFLKDYYERLTK